MACCLMLLLLAKKITSNELPQTVSVNKTNEKMQGRHDTPLFGKLSTWHGKFLLLQTYTTMLR